MKKFFILFVFAFLLIGSVYAIDWPFNKEQSCVAFNVTGTSCEQFWCQSIQGGNYSIEKEICEFKIIVNETIIINQTINDTNSSNNLSLNTSDFYNKTEIDDMFRSQRDSFANETEKLEDKFFLFSGNQNPTSSGGSDGLIIIIAVAVVVVLGGFYIMNKKPQIPARYPGEPQGYERPVPKMIKSRRELSEEDEFKNQLEEVKKELSNLKKQKQEISKPEEEE